jgi:hypothetical protein
MSDRSFKWRGQTWSMQEVQQMVFDSVMDSTECPECETTKRVEPDASNYLCDECGKGRVHSPLVVLGLM